MNTLKTSTLALAMGVALAGAAIAQDAPTPAQQKELDGARAYAARGCPTCHGAPGVGWAKFSEGMRPYPPDLKEVAKAREPQQLFWVIKHGINMTGMPGFALIEVPDQEIWTIAAFVKKLPAVSEGDYKAWSAPPVVTPLPSPR